MTIIDVFKHLIQSNRPRLLIEAERPLYEDRPGFYAEDRDRVLEEHAGRKYPFEKAPPGPRLLQLFTPGPDGQLAQSDARRQPAAAAGPAPTNKPVATIAAPAAKPKARDLRQRIKELKAEIQSLEGRKR